MTFSKYFIVFIVLTVFTVFTAACSPHVTFNRYDPNAPNTQQQQALLQGTLTTRVTTNVSEAKPITAVSLSLQDTKGSTSLQTTTDAKGLFHFEHVTPGAYTLQLLHKKYYTQTFDITLLPGQTRDLQIPLDAITEVAIESAHVTGVVFKGLELRKPSSQQDHSGVIIEYEFSL